MRKLVFLCCILAVMPGSRVVAQEVEPAIQELAGQLSQSMAGQVKKLAVVEFPELNGHQSALGQFIAEELITNFSSGARLGQFDIVERRQLARVLREQELTDSSLFDDKSIAKIGKILGIDAIVTGSIADLGTEVKVNARVISVETAKVFAAAAIKFKKSETVQQLLGAGVGSMQSLTASAVPPSNAGAVAFQDEFLRIELSSMNISKDKRKITMTFVVQNLTSQELFLALGKQNLECDVSVMDETGAMLPSDSGSQEFTYVSGLPCIYDRLGDQDSYAKILPGAKLPMAVVFKKTKEIFGGKFFTFRAGLLRFTGSSGSRLLSLCSISPLGHNGTRVFEISSNFRQSALSSSVTGKSL